MNKSFHETFDSGISTHPVDLLVRSNERIIIDHTIVMWCLLSDLTVVDLLNLGYHFWRELGFIAELETRKMSLYRNAFTTPAIGLPYIDRLICACSRGCIRTLTGP